MKIRNLILISCGFLSGIALFGSVKYVLDKKQSTAPPADFYGQVITASPANKSDEAQQGLIIHYRGPQRISGQFLASRFAQNAQQWDKAAEYINRLENADPSSSTIMQKSMILNIAAGDINHAIETARTFAGDKSQQKNVRALADLFVITGDFKKDAYDTAKADIKNMTEDHLTTFIKPLLVGWQEAGEGNFNADLLRGHPLHLRHAIYIARYLNDQPMLDKAIEALKENNALTLADQNLLGTLQNDPEAKSLQPVITRPAEGLALAYYNLAQTLMTDQAYESARIFAQLALYLKPADPQTTALLAEMEQQSGQNEKALALYQSIPETATNYAQAQYKIAAIYSEAGQTQKALRLINEYYKKTGDIEALIEKIYILRATEDHQDILKTFTALEKKMGTVGFSDDQWYLYYLRGISREQTGDWTGAKADLEKALALNPDHPFILNYLGYSMADRGIDLPAALEMVEKALKMAPQDGFITDSLGWIYFQMHDYDQAVPYLESAIALEPGDPVINDHLGDAYWQAGRTLEARYQWQRAKQAAAKKPAENAELIKTLDQKMVSGLPEVSPVNTKQAEG